MKLPIPRLPARLLVPLALLACAGLAQAQLYKWTDARGKLHFTDTPPPSGAQNVEQRVLSGSPGSAADLPYEVAEAVRAHPVVLYTTPKCLPCDDGRALLQRRGVPYAEKTVVSNEDIARLRQAGGEQQLPFLTVGRGRHHGFEPGSWNIALSAAGYPETSRLPRSWQAAQAEPAAGVPAAPAAATATARAPSETLHRDVLPAQGSNVPPGFRF